MLRTHVVPALETKAVGKITAADLDNLYSKLAATRQPKTTAPNRFLGFTAVMRAAAIG